MADIDYTVIKGVNGIIGIVMLYTGLGSVC